MSLVAALLPRGLQVARGWQGQQRGQQLQLEEMQPGGSGSWLYAVLCSTWLCQAGLLTPAGVMTDRCAVACSGLSDQTIGGSVSLQRHACFG